MNHENSDEPKGFLFEELSEGNLFEYLNKLEMSREFLHYSMKEFMDGKLGETAGVAYTELFDTVRIHMENFYNLVAYVVDDMKSPEDVRILTQIADEEQRVLLDNLRGLTQLAEFELDSRDDLYTAMAEYSIGRNEAWESGLDPDVIYHGRFEQYVEPDGYEETDEVVVDDGYDSDGDSEEEYDIDDFGVGVMGEYEEKLLSRVMMLTDLLPPGTYKDE